MVGLLKYLIFCCFLWLEYFSKAGKQCSEAIVQEEENNNGIDQCFDKMFAPLGPTITQKEICRYITYASAFTYSATGFFLVFQRPRCGGRVYDKIRIKDLPYKFCLQKIIQGFRAVFEGALWKRSARMSKSNCVAFCVIHHWQIFLIILYLPSCINCCASDCYNYNLSKIMGKVKYILFYFCYNEWCVLYILHILTDYFLAKLFFSLANVCTLIPREVLNTEKIKLNGSNLVYLS